MSTNKSPQIKALAAANAKPAEAAPRDGHVAQASEALNASRASDGAMVNAILYSADNGAFTVAELVAAGYSDGSARSMSSEWNRGAVVAHIIGKDAVRRVISEARATSTTNAYKGVLGALRVIAARAATAIGKGKTATRAQVKTLTAGAAAESQVKVIAATKARKARPASVKRVDTPDVKSAGPLLTCQSIAGQLALLHKAASTLDVTPAKLKRINAKFAALHTELLGK